MEKWGAKYKKGSNTLTDGELGNQTIGTYCIIAEFSITSPGFMCITLTAAIYLVKICHPLAEN